MASHPQISGWDNPDRMEGGNVIKQNYGWMNKYKREGEFFRTKPKEY